MAILPAAPDAPDAAQLRRWLDPVEIARMDRFRFARDQWSYGAAHALLRGMLARYHGAPPADWRFRAEESGRPVIDTAAGPGGAHPPRFSISHTHGLAACALTLPVAADSGLEVGVDAEATNRTPSALELAERFFHPAEAADLGRLAAADQAAGFLTLWTLKEAVVKAVGVGITGGLERFRLRTAPPVVEHAEPPLPPPGRWHLGAWDTADGAHALALALVTAEADQPPPGVVHGVIGGSDPLWDLTG